MKYDVMKYDVMKYGVMKYDVKKYNVMKYDVMKYNIMTYDIYPSLELLRIVMIVKLKKQSVGQTHMMVYNSIVALQVNRWLRVK